MLLASKFFYTLWPDPHAEPQDIGKDCEFFMLDPSSLESGF